MSELVNTNSNVKRIIVNNEKCSACGSCTLQCDLLQEAEDGKAIAVNGGMFSVSDDGLSESVNNVIANCPSGALGVEDASLTNKRDKEGILDLAKTLRGKAQSFSLKEVTNRDVIFRSKDYENELRMEIRNSMKPFESESKAKSAAADEFNRNCYSDGVRNAELLRIVIEYKNKVLRKFFTLADNDSSAYYPYIKELRAFLSDIYVQANELAGNNSALPDSWKNLSMEDIVDAHTFNPLLTFESLPGRFGSGKFGDIENLDYYVGDVDIEDFETYSDKKDWRGNWKRVTRYRYYGESLYNAAGSFWSDFHSTVGGIDITGMATRCIGGVFYDINKNIKKCLEQKAMQLEEFARSKQ